MNIVEKWQKTEIPSASSRGGLTAKDWLLQNGWTNDDIKALRETKHDGAVTSLGSWPSVGGKSLYPYSWALTDQERADYNALKSSGSTGSSGTRKVSTLTLGQWNDMMSFLKGKLQGPDLKQVQDMLAPVAPAEVQKVRQMSPDEIAFLKQFLATV